MSKPSAAPSESRQKFEKQVEELCTTLEELRPGTGAGIQVLLTMAYEQAERDAREQCAQLLKEEAGEIGTYVAYHIEEMYPGAVKATPKSFLLSVRNFTSNKIAALAELVRGKGGARNA